jgi:hypothetical protein
MRRLAVFFAFILALVGFTGAVANSAPPAQVSSSRLSRLPSAAIPPLTNIASPSRVFYGPSYFPEDVDPLTGLPGDDLRLFQRRPIVIKVTNFPRSVRPQWGLSQADQVFEYYIGDEMSRFIGIFYGKDASRVGPVRSARLACTAAYSSSAMPMIRCWIS